MIRNSNLNNSYIVLPDDIEKKQKLSVDEG